ncbi:MAG: hypothetical protein IJY10_05860 [Lachnospiraceae bacterium]|nr:hypothetical protein [Lachnospiraceae bacterium]
MKCINCGGEVDSQSAKCPYCGSLNEEGLKFQQEVASKLARNRLLPKFILKDKTPDMLHSFLWRVMFSFSVAGVLLFIIGFGIYFIADEMLGNKEPSGYAKENYYTRTENSEDIYIFPEDFMMQIMVDLDTGVKPYRSRVEYVLEYTYRLMVSDTYKDEEGYHELCLECYAFLKGYLKLEEEEIEYLLENEGERYPKEEVITQLVDLVHERIGGLQ